MGRHKIRVGDMVKMKPVEELFSLGIKLPKNANLPYIDDVGIVIQVNETRTVNYLLVHWQKANEECKHFATVLDKIERTA